MLVINLCGQEDGANLAYLVVVPLSISLSPGRQKMRGGLPSLSTTYYYY